VGEISVHIYGLTVLAKALKPLPVVKTDADGKTYDAFADAKVPSSLRGFNGK
jgi:lysyl-tRNA synthetase class 2